MTERNALLSEETRVPVNRIMYLKERVSFRRSLERPAPGANYTTFSLGANEWIKQKDNKKYR